MFVYIARRIVYVIPIVVSVALVCFMLVHITPGDPLVAILPADASQELAAQLRIAYGFDRPLPVQFGLYVRPGTRLTDVRRVLTHPHAAAQCRDWMRVNLPQASVTEGGSTAAAAGCASGCPSQVPVL